jgi:hypothetical protein
MVVVGVRSRERNRRFRVPKMVAFISIIAML